MQDSPVLNTKNLPNAGYQLGIEITCHCEGEMPQIQSKWLDNFIRVNNPVPPSEVNWTAENDQLKSDINILKLNRQEVVVEGWVFPETKVPISENYLTVSNNGHHLAFKTTGVERSDVAVFYGDSTLKRAGFMVKFDQAYLSPGIYNLGFLLLDAQHKKYLHGTGGRTIEIKIDGSDGRSQSTEVPVEIESLNFPMPAILTSLPPDDSGMKGFIDKISEQKYYYKVEGWSYISNIDDKDSRIFLVLESANGLMKIPCEKRFRPDLKEAFGHTFNTDSSGFEVGLRKEDFAKDTYQLILLIENKNSLHSVRLNNSIEFK